MLHTLPSSFFQLGGDSFVLDDAVVCQVGTASSSRPCIQTLQHNESGLVHFKGLIIMNDSILHSVIWPGRTARKKKKYSKVVI